MSNDIELLEEALDLSTASRQMDLAQMGYNDAVENEANRQRELHELKPASWWAQTFNTDGELRRREEGTKITIALNTAKRQKEVFSMWHVALEPAAEKFKKGPYRKIIAELKKAYPGVKAKDGSTVRGQALSGELNERNALLNAYSSKYIYQTHISTQKKCSKVSQQLFDTSRQLQSLEKPSLFAQVFNTAKNKQYKQRKDNLLQEKSTLQENYKGLLEKKQRTQHGAMEYISEFSPVLALFAKKHLDIKPFDSNQTNTPAPVITGLNMIIPATKKKSISELWGIAPKDDSSYNLNTTSEYESHPHKLSNPNNPPTPKTLI